MPENPPGPHVLTQPPGAGWYWWRQQQYDPWRVVEVHGDQEGLYSRSDEDMDYQCGDNPGTPFSGQWWSVPIEPPPA